ncbi:SDR family oxidoreductase [Spirosoma aureum]|nr:SDR family oxidoreductase [Spirosoma aureum]
MNTKENTVMNSRSGLAGKRILLLGGTSGIGFATAQAAAQEDALIVVVSSNKQRVDQAVAELPEGTEGYAVDLTNEDQVRGFFDSVGSFDHLVFTAGESLQLGELASTSLDSAQQYFNLRYWGAFMAAKYAAPHILPGGSIVFTTGIVSLRPQKGWSLGASICGAMDAFTRAMAMELAPIRVNAVCPGVVKTDLWKNMSETDRVTMYDQIGRSLPVGRIGEGSDIAQTYLYLMKQEWSTGQILVVDGGAVLV